MASLLLMYTKTLVSLPGGGTHTCNKPINQTFTTYFLTSVGTEWIILTVLGFILCTVMLQLLAAAIAALSSFQRLLEQALGLHDGRRFFLREQDVGCGATAGGEQPL